jgi:hypothetical protein
MNPDPLIDAAFMASHCGALENSLSVAGFISPPVKSCALRPCGVTLRNEIGGVV